MRSADLAELLGEVMNKYRIDRYCVRATVAVFEHPNGDDEPVLVSELSAYTTDAVVIVNNREVVMTDELRELLSRGTEYVQFVADKLQPLHLHAESAIHRVIDKQTTAEPPTAD